MILFFLLLLSFPVFAYTDVVYAGTSVLGGFAVYAGILMFSGVRRFKEEGYEVLHHGAVSAALFALALLLGYLSAQFATYFAKQMNLTGRCFSQPSLTLDNATLYKFAEWSAKGLNCASDSYSRWVGDAAGSTSVLLATVGLGGSAPVVQNLAINFGQLLMAYISAVLSFAPLFVASKINALFAGAVLGTQLLLFLAAVGVLHERTRALASGVLGVYGASPTLIIGADVLSQKIKEIGGVGLAVYDPFVPFFWTEAAKKTFALMEIAATAALVLVVYGALAYGISRIFDHAGASLAGE